MLLSGSMSGPDRRTVGAARRPELLAV